MSIIETILLHADTPMELLYIVSFIYGFTHVRIKYFLSEPFGSVFVAIMAGIFMCTISMWTIGWICPEKFLFLPIIIFFLASINNLIYGAQGGPLISFVLMIKRKSEELENPKEK